MYKNLSALQAASILLLCRLTAFFCCGAPYTAAYAGGMAAAVLLQSILLLPLLYTQKTLLIRKPLLLLYRIYALLWAAWLLSQLFTLLNDLQMPHPLLTVGMLLTALGYTLLLPVAATARTAVLLLVLTAAGFLLLPISGIGTARRKAKIETQLISAGGQILKRGLLNTLFK